MTSIQIVTPSPINPDVTPLPTALLRVNTQIQIISLPNITLQAF